MRGTKAKSIRKQAKELAGMVDLQPKGYEAQQHKAKLVRVGFGPKDFRKVVPITIKLNDCERRLYQDLKRLG